MRAVVPILTVVAAIVVLWYAAAVPMNAQWARDQAARADAYKQVQQIVHDDAPWLFVANWKQNAVTSEAVENFALQPSFLLNLHKVAKN